ncbi:lytic transglycosylase domain-containing protein [Parvularcula sp. ZS-1/3]|uniref:Lytic transglycosylase domain-containing protein n=1 Tax=Parvularcula mediterranea TaxID=2732508 RepID=A0A7Y3W679_9PROT|nr:transglycosylase SLT domain-containing protein [Parvularcula mediterranea]NNU17439.1 lytic transglycosylase domain-containing protein [Parvularcula mediterranea]
MSIEPLAALKDSDTSKGSVTKAIRQAARQTGLDFDLMLGVAKRESSLRADAKAATSSASGLFQFIDQTWLGAVKEHGDQLGLSEFANDIQRGEKGFTVDDPARREEILNLRFKPAVAAKVAGKTLAAAKDRLSNALGREASGSEVYMAHFLGERGALRMLQAGETATAATVDPRAAKANQPLFYEGGRALSVSEFRDKIALHLGKEPAPQLAETPAVRVPYKPTATPRPAPRVETYAQPTARSVTDFSKTMPPQLYAAIVEMQSDFILGGKDDS